MTHTDEQLAIFEAMKTTNSNLVIDAKAGSGKTSTLLDGLPLLTGDTLFMAYNRAIADEIKLKASRKLDFLQQACVQISTVHSHGLKSFKTSGLFAKTLSSKCNFMLKDMLEARVDKNDDIWRNTSKISNLVSNAKSAGFGLSGGEDFPSIQSRPAWEQLAEHHNVEDSLVGETSIDEIITFAIKLLEASNKRTNSIDFDDMIYLPLLLNLKLPLYDNVLIDEAQDINVTRRELAFRSIKPSGRIIAVGDPRQAIYGFTGASVDSLNEIQARASATVLPLSVCWRCDADIIRSAQEQEPLIQSRPGAPDGQVLTIDFEKDDFLSLPQANDAILCRINKPNVAVCLGLLRRGVRAKIEGRDIGRKLEDHVQRAAPLYATQELAMTLLDMEPYREAEITKLVVKNKTEAQIALLEDEIDAATLILERAIEQFAPSGPTATWPDFQHLLGTLFGDDVKGCVVLSSVHKAKGREWKRVFLLGYNDWMPHHMAKMDWEKGQEQNLIYVAKTRAASTLVFVNGAQSAIDRGLHREGQRVIPDVN